MLKLKIHSFAKIETGKYICQLMLYDSVMPNNILTIFTQLIEEVYDINKIKKEIKEKAVKWKKAQAPEAIKTEINQILDEIVDEIKQKTK